MSNNQLTVGSQNEAIELAEKCLCNVREELRNNPYIIEALRVLPAGGYRSAIGSFWNAVVDDLRNKVIFRSLALFNKEMGNKLPRLIKTYEDFHDISDDILIEGAYKIGVIGWEASKILKQAKETRHLFSGHPKSSEPSIIKVLSVMEDCIKYVLSQDYPMQIIDINDYITLMGTSDYDRNSIAIENALGDLPEIYKNELINRFYKSYIHPDCSTTLRSNIEFCAPLLWKTLSREVKIQVVRRVDEEITKGNVTQIRHAFSFVESVNAVNYLSNYARIYKAKPLIDELYENVDNWDTENKCVRKLEPYASVIPPELIEKYVSALTQTYIGRISSSHYFARTDFYANGAALRIPSMFALFDDASAEAFISAIRTNETIKNRIRHPAKMRRLRSLGNIVLERVSGNFREKWLLELLVNEKKEHEFFDRIEMTRQDH